ncbi:ATP-binding protein, partial [Candidatus Poribacteria bacterium]
SRANEISDELDDMLASAEMDFQDSVYALDANDKRSLRRFSYQIEDRHKVIGQVFFLSDSGEVIFPEDPRRAQEVATESEAPAQQEDDVFQYYLSEAERQEFKHNNPQRAIQEYQKILSDLKHPAYKTITLNSIARCYVKLGLDREAVGYYKEIVDKYADVTDRWVNIPAIAHLQAASIYGKIGNTDAAVQTLLEFYSDLAEDRWDLDAEEMSYFADRAQRQLLAYKDRGDVQFSTLADGFAEIDVNVIREVKLREFLEDYEHLAAEEMTQIAESATKNSESVEHLIKYRSVAGPYLISYFINLSAGMVAGFEVNLNHLASQGFREVLSDFIVEDDIMLAILNENDEIIEVAHASSTQDTDWRDTAPPGEPIAMVEADSLPFWKVGIYVNNPMSLEKRSKRKASQRAFLIIGLILAIAFGIYLSLREARRETELARIRSDFVANVSHELRTPLSSIQIFSETLKQNKAVSQDKQDQYLDTISSESDRLTRLVDNVLDFSRLERQVKEFDFQPVNIGEVIASTVEAARFYAEQRGAAVSLRMVSDLPEIRADKGAISQMVMNLIDNAVKYSEDESEIAVNVFRRGQNIVIQVVDKGVGIDEEDMGKIFDKFYRGKNVANLGTGGTGLGLTLAKAVAIAHGGDITVRSKKGEGSRFSVVLPMD